MWPSARHNSAPPPDLRIVPINCIHPHEDHDSQRSLPLIERIRDAAFITNPPIVAQMEAGRFVVLDGANRYSAFLQLGYQHLLVQVVDYDSEFVELGVWQHVISGWNALDLVARIDDIPELSIKPGWDASAVTRILLHDGPVLSIHTPAETIAERSAMLRSMVRVYQQNAVLHRTSHTDPSHIWPLYPDAIALVLFPQYEPEDIIAAARYKAYLPPGVSRHIIHGRALKVNYPLKLLRDENTPLEEKNAALKKWVQEKLANRAVRYYAEATYQFDE